MSLPNPLLGGESDSEEEDEPVAMAIDGNGGSISRQSSIFSRGGSLDDEEEEDDDDDDMDEGGRGAPSLSRRQSLGGAVLSKSLTEAQLASASDRFREAWSRVQANQWDVRSWQAILSEAQTQRSGRAITLREVYRLILKQFPTTVRFWKDWAEHELRQGNLTEVDAIFQQCLFECPSVDLYMLYINRVRKSNPAALGDGTATEVDQQRDKVTEAFELAVRQVGVMVNSTPLWWDYINYVKAWKDDGQTEQGSKIATLRKVFHRAVLVPIDGLDEIWRTYETWEKGLNEHVARTTLPSLQPGHVQAKAVARDRRMIVEQQKLNKMAVPPGKALEEKEQLGILRRRLDFERSNPENVDPVALKDRVRLAYRTSMAYFYRFPEVWYEFAQYEAETDDVEAGASLYERAIEAIPDSVLLHLAYAELEESRGQSDHGVDLLKKFVEREPTTLGYIIYQHYVRRTQGKEAARKVFSSTKELRKKGVLTYHIYLAHAKLELHINHEQEVARRVLDYGLSQHPEFLQEPDYVLATLDLLIQLHDDQNVRGLCDRALAALGGSDAARPIWQKLLDFEMAMGRDRDMARVERVQKRIADVYPKEKEPHPFLRLWRRVAVFETPPTTEVDDLLRKRWNERETGPAAAAAAMAAAAAAQAIAQRMETTTTLRGGDRRGGRDDIIGQAAAMDGPTPSPTEGMAVVEEKRDPRKEIREARRREEAGIKAMKERRLQSIPEYLRKLYLLLPSHTGPPPDADTIIRSLRDNPLPPKPTAPLAPPVTAAEDSKPKRDPRGRGGGGRKRGRWGGGGDSDSGGSDDEAGKALGGAAPTDVFRARQQEKLMKTL